MKKSFRFMVVAVLAGIMGGPSGGSPPVASPGAGLTVQVRKDGFWVILDAADTPSGIIMVCLGSKGTPGVLQCVPGDNMGGVSSRKVAEGVEY